MAQYELNVIDYWLIVKKRKYLILLAAGLLLVGGSAVRAAEDVAMPGTLNLAPVPAEPCGAAPACGGHCHCRHSRSRAQRLM